MTIDTDTIIKCCEITETFAERGALAILAIFSMFQLCARAFFDVRDDMDKRRKK